MSPKKIWLDCDPGRDDLAAILLALHHPNILLTGISSVHGNSSIEAMTYNAVRCLCSFGSDEQSASIPVATGTSVPLVMPKLKGSLIHGVDGLGGVEGLLDMKSPLVEKKLKEALLLNAVDAMSNMLKSIPKGEKLTLVATGAFTNVALLVGAYPELVKEKCDAIVVMGGAEGRGNKSPVAESNVLCDPHAASIVFNFDIPVVMCPLNLTHTALFTHDIHTLLLQPDTPLPISDSTPLPKPKTSLRHTVSTDLTFFAEAYKAKYNFPAPPLHDALTVAYVSNPELFSGKRYRVDVELEGKFTIGATVVDLWEYRKEEVDQSEENWGMTGKNVLILEKVDVPAFWKVFLEAVATGDEVCPVNKL